MPSSTLTSLSTILTPEGWCQTDRSVASINALGIDRHGRAAIQPVSIRVSDDSCLVCFVGTRAAVGAFHHRSLLVDSAGIRRSVQAVVEAESLSAFRFERAIEPNSELATPMVYARIWDALRAICIAASEEDALFRALGSTASVELLKRNWVKLHAVGQYRYVSIRRAAFESDIQVHGLSVLLEIVKVLTLSASGLWEVECRNYQLFLWLMSFLRSQDSSYRLLFDSVQHSTVVTLDLNQVSTAVEQARTAFVSGQALQVDLEWEDRMWNPVSSGFVVSAGS